MNSIGFIDDDIKTSNIIEYYNIQYAADRTVTSQEKIIVKGL